MRKFLALAALVLGVAACQTEPEDLNVTMGGEQLVTVNVAVPEIETRAAGQNSALGAFANGVLGTADDNTTMRYILQVYYKNGENYVESNERLVEYSDDKKVAFEVRLVPERNYQFVVWADVVTDGKNDTDNHYVTTDLKNITLNGEWKAMDESRDAFTATEYVENYNGEKDIDIKLTRPFAKLRVVTTDIKNLTNLGIVPTTATVVYSENHRVAFNALTGKAAGATETKTHTYTIAQYNNESNTGAEYTLFSDYFFAENEVVKFDLSVYEDAAMTKLIKANAFKTDIYVKRNFLTTIKGNILTENNGFDVEIDDAFGGESGIEEGQTFAKVGTVEDLREAIEKGVKNITLEGDIDLSELAAGTLSTRAGEAKNLVIEKELTLDFAGYTIKGAVERNNGVIVNKSTLTVKNGTITSLGENGGAVISNMGTLTITDMTINGAPTNTATGTAAYAVNTDGVGSTTIANNVNVSGRGAISATNGAKVEINGGSYNTPTVAWGHAIYAVGEGTEVVINDGTFSEGYEYSANNWGMYQIYSGEKAKVIVYGGNFSQTWDCANGYDLCTATEGTIEIYGGTFAENPSSQNGIDYVVKGYKAEQENGVYVVRKPQALIDLENTLTNGGEITLNEDITLINPLVIPEGKEVTINLNGKTLDVYTPKSAGAVLKNEGTLAIEGGIIASKGDNGGSAIMNNGTLTVKNATLNGAPNADGGWPSYTVNNVGTLTIENTTITSNHGAVCSYAADAVITLNNCTLDMAGIKGFTSHGIYTYNGGKIIINGGTYENKATDQNATGGSVINGNVEVNAGTFTGRIENYYGTPVLKGGTYSEKPKDAFVAEGYKVIEENGKYNVVLDAVDDVVSSTDTLEEAIAAGSDTIALSAGEYVIPDSAAGKTIAFVGTGAPEDTLITALNDGASEGNCDYSLRGSKATFENVTITTTGTYFPGYAGCQGTYKNCIINGVFTLYDSSSFENCTFNITGDLYNVWTWGAAEATFTNCTFNCEGKAMLLYGQANTKLTMNNCVFNDNGDNTVTDKAAIEIGNDYNKSYELTVNKATVNGFAINPKGFVTGTTLWANKNSMPASKLKVTIDGKNAYNYVAAADDAESFADAITNGATEVALSTGNYTMPEPDLRGKTLTITGTKDVVVDATAVDARDQFVTGATMVFDGVTINFGKVNYMGFANTASLTYRNCHINGLQFLFGENVTFENCTFDSNGAEHSVWTYGCKNVSFTECDFTYGDRCVNCYSDNDVEGGQTVNFTKCTFTTENTASEGAVETNSCFIKDGIKVTLDGCTAPAYGELVWVSTWDSTNGANTTITVK